MCQADAAGPGRGPDLQARRCGGRGDPVARRVIEERVSRAMPSPKPSSPVFSPIEPMLAKLTEALPTGPGYLYEPKWDGFRAIVFRDGADLLIQSRDLRPLDRYFPELHA